MEYSMKVLNKEVKFLTDIIHSLDNGEIKGEGKRLAQLKFDTVKKLKDVETVIKILKDTQQTSDSNCIIPVVSHFVCSKNSSYAVCGEYMPAGDCKQCEFLIDANRG